MGVVTMGVTAVFTKAWRNHIEASWRQQDANHPADEAAYSRIAPLRRNAVRALLVAAYTLLDYLLMLLAMSFNVGIFSSVIVVRYSSPITRSQAPRMTTRPTVVRREAGRKREQCDLCEAPPTTSSAHIMEHTPASLPQGFAVGTLCFGHWGLGAKKTVEGRTAPLLTGNDECC